MAQPLNEENFERFLTGSGVPVLVDFYRDGCVPCRRVAPLVSRAETDYEGRLVTAKVNIAQCPGLTGQFAVQAAPTLILMDGQRELTRLRGATDQETFRVWLENGMKGRERTE